MESPPPKKTISDAKKQAIQRLLRQIMADVSAGKTFDEAAIIAAHPELMPELQAGLKKIREIKNNRTPSQAGQPLTATIAPPTIGQTMLPPSEASLASGAIHHSQVNDQSAIGIPGYTLQREVGRGGQAVVYLAIQQSTGRKVAIKLISKQALADERALARFKREVQVLAALDHPNIVGIIDTGAASDGSQFIVMSYVGGSSLDEYMKVAQVSSDRGKLLRLFLKICDAVNFAHLRGIVHRDLKPGNIRIDERGEPHVLDFGLAHTALDHLAGGDHPMSIDGEFLGSLPWSSPEQAQADPERIDIRSDVYSLGVILYQILTNGKFPYEVVGNIRDVLNNILSAPPTPPSKIDPARAGNTPINPVIERIVMKALAKNREERYQTAGELGRDVSRYLAGQKPAGRQVTEAAPAPPPAKSPLKSFALAGIGGVILCALGVAVGLYLHKNRQAQASSMASQAPTPIVATIVPSTQSVAAPVLAPTSAPAPSSPPLATRIGSGSCHIDGDTINLIPAAKGICTLYFGTHAWSEYDLTFQVLTNSNRGFWIQPHVIGTGQLNQVLINTYGDNIAFSSFFEETWRRIGQAHHFRLEPDHWYNAHLVARGPDTNLFLDDQEITSTHDENITHGIIGIGTRCAAAQFRDIKVFSPGGALMWSSENQLATIAPAADVDTGDVTPPPAYRKINLLANSHPHFDALDGIWTLRAGILTGQGQGAQLPFDYTPSGEYEYRISVNRELGIQPIALIAVQNGHQFAWVIGGHRDTIAGFAMVAGKDYDQNNSTRQTQGRWLTPESKVTLVLRVAKDSVTAYVNGAMSDFYKTDFSDMSLPPTWHQQSSPTLGLWVGGGHVAIDAADVLTYSTPFNAPLPATTEPSKP